ncbi:MAG: nucleotide exchange factor GrpE [Patescibacteria group bacterium]
MTDDDIAKKIAVAQAKDDTVTKLEADLTEANKKVEEMTEAAKHALADLQNFRKKTEEEKNSFVAFANTSLILELLPVLDNFARAFAAVPEEILETDWFKGALQIEQQLMGIMRKQGVVEMESQVGKKADVRLHDALAAGSGEKEVVIEEFEKGYMLGDKVLRPAKVKVGDGTVTPKK